MMLPLMLLMAPTCACMVDNWLHSPAFTPGLGAPAVIEQQVGIAAHLLASNPAYKASVCQFSQAMSQ